MEHDKSLARKMEAYALAAGAGALMASAAPSQAVMNVYNNGGAGWFDAIPEWGTPDVFTDMIQFRYDGTVLVGEAAIEADGVYASRFTLGHDGNFDWAQPDDKDASLLFCGTDTGFVDGSGRDVGRLGGGTYIGGGLDESPWRGWWAGDGVAALTPSDWANAGGFQGYNYYMYGEWFFGGRGFVGLYSDEGDGRHYGWADIHTGPARNEFTLYEFAFSDQADQPVWIGGGEAILAPGDFNGDGNVDDLDIDRMGDAIRGAWENFELYDISADGLTGGQDNVIDVNDLDYLIRFLVEAGAGNGTEYGDFNLDGLIDTTDLTRLATDYGTGDTWAKGNANRYIDLITDTTDLTILATFYGFGVPDVIPEPMTLSLLALGASGLLARRRR